MIPQTDATNLVASYLMDSEEDKDSFQFSDIYNFAAATVVDIGVTAVDSLSFGAFDLKEKGTTEEILQWMSEDTAERLES